MANRPSAKAKRLNLDLPSQTRERLRNLAKAANEPEAVLARALLIDAIERAEREAFRKRLARSRTPERRARDLEIVSGVEAMPRRTARAQGKLRVGSKVSLTFGVSQATGVVIEDRGNLGVGGRRLWRVRLDMGLTSEPIELEARAETLTVLSDPLFADRAVFGGPTPTDLAKKHDADLYGDLEYEALDRRMQSVRDGTATLVPWEKARTELLRKVSPRAAKELERSLAVVRKRRVNRRKAPVL